MGGQRKARDRERPVGVGVQAVGDQAARLMANKQEASGRTDIGRPGSEGPGSGRPTNRGGAEGSGSSS